MELIDSNEIIISFVYIFIILIIAWLIKSRYQNQFPEYKYFVIGLLFKIIGVLAFCLVYIYYYGGGDTINYFKGAESIANLLKLDFDKGVQVLFNTDSPYNSWKVFNSVTGYPAHYMWKDPNTFSVSRYTSFFVIIGNGSFLVSSYLTACFSYIGIWKLYRLFNNLYPDNSRVFAYLILFLPTLLFWGGGIMKDSYVLCATCWITYNFYQVFISRNKIFWNIIFIVINLIIILNTKAYVIISLLPGMLLWLNSAYLKNTKGIFRRIIIFPFLIIFLAVGGYYSITNLGELMGVYGDVDSAIQQAQIIQEDLLRENQYGNNSYNIGEIDGSIGGIISLAPLAIITALYRPLFWEIGSPMMVISVIENMILLVFTIIILVRVSPLKLIRIIFSEPFLLYTLVFSLLFAFGVGVAGTNFGALVRYKIPLVPFFFPMIYMIYKFSRKNKTNLYSN